MRTTPWRRRRVNDIPRPAGRGISRWRNGSLARRLVAIRPIHPIRTIRQRRGGGTRILEPIESRAPVSPAPAGAAESTSAEEDSIPAHIPLLPGEPSLRRRFFFFAANTCTVVSILLGMSAVMLSLSGRIQLAAVLLLGCIVADAVDGPLARRFGVASPFGAQMDSLADMCSFGLVTPLVVYQWLYGDISPWAVGAACGMVAVCAALRLARFNITPKDGRYFSGVPTTLAATVLVISVLLLAEPHPVTVIGIAALALLMVSPFPYAKLAQLRHVPIWLWPVPVAGMVLNVELTFLGLVSAYLISGPVLWVVQRRQRRLAAV